MEMRGRASQETTLPAECRPGGLEFATWRLRKLAEPMERFTAVAFRVGADVRTSQQGPRVTTTRYSHRRSVILLDRGANKFPGRLSHPGIRLGPA